MNDLHGRFRDHIGQIGRVGQLGLPRDNFQIRIFDIHFDSKSFHVFFSKSGSNFRRKTHDGFFDVIFTLEIAAESYIVTDGFGLCPVLIQKHRRLIETVSIVVDLATVLPQKISDHGSVAAGKISNGTDAAFAQFAGRSRTDEEQFTDVQRPEKVFVILTGNNRRRVRLFVLAAHLGEDLVKRNACRKGKSVSFADTLSDLIGDLLATTKKLLTGSNIQPAFVHAKRLNLIGILQIDLVDQLAVMSIFVMMWRDCLQTGTFFLRLPNGLRGNDTVGFGNLVFGQYNTMTVVRASANGHWHIPQFRIVQKLNGGEEPVHVTVQYDPVFLFVGRMMTYKGLPLILDALKQLSDAGQDFRMVFVGKGPDKESMEQKAEELGLKSRCFFTGPIYDREALRAWNTRADLFLFPSTFDTNGLVVREAAACGLASVLIEGSCAAEGITDGRNGFTIQESPEAMAALLQTACRDLDHLRGVGQNAMDEIVLSWQDSVSEAYKRYGEILEKKKSGLLQKKKLPADYFMSVTAHTLEEREKHRQIRREIFRDFRETAVGMMENIQDAGESVESFLDRVAENIHEKIDSHKRG